MTTLPELLQRLSEVAPEVCTLHTSPNGNAWKIGIYSFWMSNGELYAGHKGTMEYGQPALDWLTGAVMRAIVGYDFSLVKSVRLNHYDAVIYNDKNNYENYMEKTSEQPAIALLAALIAAKGE